MSPDDLSPNDLGLAPAADRPVDLRDVAPSSGEARRAVSDLVRVVERLTEEAERLRHRVAELENLADTDPLAPVLNRRAFVREFDRLIQIGKRYGLSPALIYFDLDGFKAVNDRYGHQAGDAVLMQVAEILRSNVRQTDVVARMGGDEFAIALASGGLEIAQAKGVQLVQLIEAEPAMFDGVAYRVGASFGAHAIEPGETAEAALARADRRMYDHKRRRAG